MSTRYEKDRFVNDVAKQACKFLADSMEILCKLLDDPSPSRRAAAAFLLKDFAEGSVAPPPDEIRQIIAQRIGRRVLSEDEPRVTRVLMSLALDVANSCSNHSVSRLSPSRN